MCSKARYVLLGIVVGALLLAGATAALAKGTAVYKVFFMDQAIAPTVGVRCIVGRTPSDYRQILRSRYSLWCYPSYPGASPLVLFYSDAGIVVQRSAPSYAPVFKASYN